MSDETNTHRLLYSEDAQSILSDLQISLRILVWGPGETNKQKWFDKRTLVIKALTEASNGLDTIITSEELFKQNPPPPVEYGFAELAHAEKADVIIALVMASPTRQGGVYRELAFFGLNRPGFRSKPAGLSE